MHLLREAVICVLLAGSKADV